MVGQAGGRRPTAGSRAVAAIALTVVALVASSAAPAAPAVALHPRLEVFVVSQDYGGRAANGYSLQPSISANGRFVGFSSQATDITESGGPGVFVRDTVAGATVRVTVAAGGGAADDDSWDPSISGDGRYVAFLSYATNLVPGPPPPVPGHIFVRDLVDGSTRVVSVDSEGGWADGHSERPSVSGDGRYVAYDSEADDIVPGDDNGVSDVFVRDMVTGTTTRISVDRDGGDAEGPSWGPSISADGQTVAFSSHAPDLTAGDGPGTASVYVRRGGATVLVSPAADGGWATGDSYGPSLSADASAVAFASWAADLVPGDANGAVDVFVHDLATGQVERVSVASDGAEGNHHSSEPSISGDGRHVAFSSQASNLVRWDRGGRTDVFVHDRARAATVRWSVDTDGGSPDGSSGAPAIAAGARRVAFSSTAKDLVGRHTNDGADIFVTRLNV